MLKRISRLSIFVVLFCPMLVFAHGGETHLLGTVTAQDARHIVVETREGETLSIRLNTETRYRQGEAAATGADLAVGARVVVEATKEGDTLTASEIRFASPSKQPAHGGEVHQH